MVKQLMMKPSTQSYFLILLLFSSFQIYCQSAGGNFSKQQVLADIDALKDILEKSHYDLYAYTPKEDFVLNFSKVRGSVNKDSFSLKEATGLYQQVISKANTGHAEIDFPAASYISFAKQGGKLFPLELALENNKAYIRRNHSGNLEIKPGLEIVTINGKSIDEILSAIDPHISAERKYLKNAKIEFWSFPRLYWQVYGEQKDFSISVKENDEIREYELQAISALEDYEYKRKDVLSSPRSLRLYDNTAYINPGNFSGDEAAFRHFIDSSFSVIKSRDSENLILDLRNNAGGNNSFSDYLVSYFADEPFRWNSDFRVRSSMYLKEHARKNKDTLDPYSKAILNHENGGDFSYTWPETHPQKSGKRFKGKVYVLVNRQTYSQAAVTAAVVQDYDFATVVGEETGDYPTLYASLFTVQLPETKIAVKIPKGYIVRVNRSEKPQGVIPDIEIRDHLLDEEDEILSGLLRRI